MALTAKLRWHNWEKHFIKFVSMTISGRRERPQTLSKIHLFEGWENQPSTPCCWGFRQSIQYLLQNPLNRKKCWYAEDIKLSLLIESIWPYYRTAVAGIISQSPQTPERGSWIFRTFRSTGLKLNFSAQLIARHLGEITRICSKFGF